MYEHFKEISNRKTAKDSIKLHRTVSKPQPVFIPSRQCDSDFWLYKLNWFDLIFSSKSVTWCSNSDMRCCKSVYFNRESTQIHTEFNTRKDRLLSFDILQKTWYTTQNHKINKYIIRITLGLIHCYTADCCVVPKVMLKLYESCESLRSSSR